MIKIVPTDGHDRWRTENWLNDRALSYGLVERVNHRLALQVSSRFVLDTVATRLLHWGPANETG